MTNWMVSALKRQISIYNLTLFELTARKRYGADQQQLATHKHRNVDSKINIKYRAVIARNFFGTLILDQCKKVHSSFKNCLEKWEIINLEGYNLNLYMFTRMFIQIATVDRQYANIYCLNILHMFKILPKRSKHMYRRNKKSR